MCFRLPWILVKKDWLKFSKFEKVDKKLDKERVEFKIGFKIKGLDINCRIKKESYDLFLFTWRVLKFTFGVRNKTWNWLKESRNIQFRNDNFAISNLRRHVWFIQEFQI